jgi:hypothetical protein
MNNSSVVKFISPDQELTRPDSVPCSLMETALAKLKQASKLTTARGRLIFGLDLTGSREATLYKARTATAAMFEAIRVLGSISVKLVYYRGDRECRAGKWHDDAGVLDQHMRRLSCETGYTQIARVLRFVLAEQEPISALVFVGDHFEETPEDVIALASMLGAKTTPIYIFHESSDSDQRAIAAKPVFKRLAEVSGGMYCEFKSDSGDVLRELLTHVAAFSAGGRAGVRLLDGPKTPEGQKLHGQLLLRDDG